MSIHPENQYPGKIDPADPEYPSGKARNITVPSDGTGTPLEAAWVNDLFGFNASILADVAEVPSGDPDTVLIPQLLNALKKGRALIDVRAFGVVGDGATDDTVALQAAIDYANALSNGGAIALQNGVFISEKLIVKSGVDLFGIGATIKLKDNSDSSLLEIPVGAANIHIEGLILDGNAANNVGVPNDIGLLHVLSTNVAPTMDVTINLCQILDAHQDGVHLTDGTTRFLFTDNLIDGTVVGDGIKLSQLVPTLDTLIDTIITGNRITGANKYGLNSDGIMLGLIVANNLFDGTGGDGTAACIRIRHFANERVVVSDNVIKNGTNTGALIGARDYLVANNVFDNNVATSLLINSAGGGDMETGVVTGNTFIAGAGSARGIWAIETEALSIAGNTFNGAFTDGIYAAANLLTITGNTIKGHSSIGINPQQSGAPGGIILGGSISGNTVVGQGPGSTLAGIRFANAVLTQYAVTGNSVTDCTDGIEEAGSCDFNTIVGNIARGNTTPITVLGASTISANNVV